MRYVELAADPLVRERSPVTAAVAEGTVDVQVRNRGTLGGNICFNDPTSNFPPLLVALGAEIQISGPAGGRRTLPARELFLGPYRCALEPGEIVAGVTLPPLREGEGVGYETLALASDSWALARAAVWLRPGPDASIAAARVVLGCIVARPVTQPGIEQELIGTTASATDVQAAVAAPLRDVDAVSDSHATGEYRIAMAREQARRAIMTAVRDSEARR